MKFVFLTGGAMLVLANTAAASAQSGGLASPTDRTNADIVVTARRRAESTLNVPIAVTVLSDKALQEQRIRNTDDIGFTTPGLTAAGGSAQTRQVVSFNIRGQGTTYGGNESVLVYLDEAQIGPYVAPLYDLASLQVLKGPQGTLFGGTSTGGAVLYTSKRASLDGIEGYAQVDIGNYNYHQFQGALNVPLTSWAALRVSTNIDRRDGFTTVVNLPGQPKFDNDKSEAFRVSLRIKAGSVTNDTIYEYYHQDPRGYGRSIFAVNQNLQCSAANAGTSPICFYGLAAVNNALAQQKALGPWAITVPILPATSATFPSTLPAAALAAYNPAAFFSDPLRTDRIVNLTNISLATGVDLRNIFSWTRKKVYPIYEGANYSGMSLYGLPVAQFADPRQSSPYTITEELQLQAQVIPDIHITTGGYYQRDKLASHFGLIFFPGFFAGFPYFPQNNTSQALFLSTDINGGLIGLHRLSLSAGVRKSWIDNITAPGLPSAVESKNNAFTYNISLNYKPNDNWMIYVAHRKGFKPGGISNPAQLPQTAAAQAYKIYAPESVKDVEVGTKARFSSGNFNGNIEFAMYRSWYDNVQQFVLLPSANTVTLNAQSSTIKGLEFSVTIHPAVQGLELSGFFGLTDAHFDKFLAPNFTTNPVTFVDMSGASFERNSKYTWQIHGSYDLPVMPTENGVVTLSATYFHRSGFHLTGLDIGIPQDVAVTPSYGVLKMRLDWRDIMGIHLDGGLFVDNVANKAYVTGGNTSQYLGNGYADYVYGTPRTFGLELRYHFGS